MTPEHLHLVVNHIPVLGAAFALIPLLTGLILRNRACLICGLVMAMVAGWTTPLVMGTGEEAYERYEHGAPAAYLDAEAEKYLHIHEERAETWSKLLYLAAVIATAALLANLRKWSYAKPLAQLTVLFCLISILAGAWIAQSGGKIRRPDFRTASAEAGYDDHDDDDD
jgi:hypothetical protein